MRLDESANLKEWLAACRKNDRRAQEKVYRHYFDAMVRLVKRYTRDEDKIVSIVNDGFLRAFKKIHKYKFTGSFEAWVRTIVFHAVSDHFKKQNNQFKLVPMIDQENVSDNFGLTDLFYEDLLSALNNVPEKSRKVFEMYAIQGYKHAEIAEALSMSEGTSKWHVSNARSVIQELLKKRNNRKYVQ